MNHKFTFTMAAFITAFILVTGGVIIGQVTQPNTVTPTPDAPDLQQDIQNLYAQREAEYQARLEEANTALAEAYAQRDAAIESSVQPQSENSSPAATTLSPQDALLVAAIAAPGAQVMKAPELVNYQGTVAYEVTLDLGILYIDANNGTVLYNGTVQPQISVQSRSFHDDDEYEHEHEHGEDHDD